MEVNLVVGKINFELPNFIPSTFNALIKNSKFLHFNIEAYFLNIINTITCPSTSFQDHAFYSTKMPAN